MTRVLVVAPPAPLVSLDEAKDHLKVDGDEQDALIEGLIAAVAGHIDGPDGWIGRAIGKQELEARFDAFDTDAVVRLPCPPIIELLSYEWLGADRQLRTGDMADVELIGDEIVPLAAAPWSGLYVGREALRVRYRAGYETLPAPIRVAVLLMVDDLFRNRGNVTSYNLIEVPMPVAAGALLRPYRKFV